mmetsp:Transcript_78452/g.188094  ORF Transcript_78452/g.188094 Transcript_78452/m.188094 type:complete len:302 (-) Transcript_78452:857-1762(-)
MRVSHRVQTRGCLQLRLLLLGLRHAIKKQRGPCSDFCHAFLDAHCAQGEAGIEVPVKGHVAHGGPIPAPLGWLHLLHELHGPGLGCPTHRHGPGVHQKRVDRIELGAQVALNMIDRVNQLAVELDLSPPNDLYAAVLADSRLVVTIHICAHGDLRLFFGICQDRFDVLGILQCILASPDGAGDRACLDPKALQVALHSHKHLRGCPHQVLLLTQVHQEAIGRRVPPLQAVEDLTGPGLAGLPESLREDGLEKVPPLELLLGNVNLLGKLPRLELAAVLAGGHLRPGLEVHLGALVVHALGA